MSTVNKFIGIMKTSSRMMMKKNENYKELKIKDYVFKFYHNPFYNFSNQLDDIYNHCQLVNKDSGKNYEFGILKNKETFLDFSKTMMICVFFKDDKPIGFFYNFYELNKNYNVSYQGTFLTSLKTEMNILNIVGPLNSLFLYEKIGDFYPITVTNVPSVVEAITENCFYSWPNPENVKFPKQQIKTIFLETKNKLKNVFLSNYEDIEIDDRLFKCSIKSSNKEYTFQDNIKKTSLAKNIKYNLFLNFWLDYKNNEFLILISLYNKINHKNNKKSIAQAIYYYNSIK